MKFLRKTIYSSHGDGLFSYSNFKEIGSNVVFEHGVLVFHPENITLGNNIYIGHNTILKGYHKNHFEIKDDTWIGQNCFFHSAGGISIGKAVGIGPMVKILTSQHNANNLEIPVMFNELTLAPVIIEDGADIGVGSIILPGITIGEGAIVGAGSVVTKNVAPYSVVAGVPAKLIKMRK